MTESGAFDQKFCEVRGKRLAYLEAGSGAPIVLLQIRMAG